MKMEQRPQTCEGCKRNVSNLNALVFLIRREYSGRHKQHSISQKILRTLICDGNYSFKKVWQRNSNKQISCEGGKIYFENFRLWYGGYNLQNEPKCLQRLPPNGPNRKVEDALMACTQPECLPLPNDGHMPSLYCLEKNWLLRHDRDTGKVLEMVYLSPRHSFRDVAWNECQRSLVLRSTHSRMSSLARQAGVPIPIVMMLAVFEVFPLTFTGMLEISKQVFGKDVMDAVISQGLLITMHQAGRVKMYSFNNILDKYRKFEARLFEEFDGEGHVCGHEPVGLPCNIHITECPPVLFEVRCAQHSVDIGGVPWHYLISPPGCEEAYFQVRRLDTRQVANNGVLQMDESNLEADKASFFGDDSGRLVHIGASDIKLYRISSDGEETTVDMEFSIDLSKKIDQEDALFTSSGRSIKRRVMRGELMDSSEMTIYNVDYEDELDVLFVSVLYHDPEAAYSMVNLYHNTTGAFLKGIRLEEPWPEIYEHRVQLDLDTVVQVIKPTQGRFSCIVYRLCSNTQDEEEAASLTATSKKRRSNSLTVRRNRPQR